MRDVVETPFNIAFQYPVGGILFGEYPDTTCTGQVVEAPGDGVGTGTARAEAIGISACQRFGYRAKSEQVESPVKAGQALHGAVAHYRDAQGAFLAVRFRDVYPACRFCPVAFAWQLLNGHKLSQGRVPCLSPDTLCTGQAINASGTVAAVLCNSPGCQEFSGIGTAQGALQHFYLIPASGLGCLHDTGL